MMKFSINTCFSELLMYVNDIKNMRLFILLNEPSQEVSTNEMESAYLEFVGHIKGISNANDYAYIFRILNFVRIELYDASRKKKCA